MARDTVSSLVAASAAAAPPVLLLRPLHGPYLSEHVFVFVHHRAVVPFSSELVMREMMILSVDRAVVSVTMMTMMMMHSHLLISSLHFADWRVKMQMMIDRIDMMMMMMMMMADCSY